jgi:hypothetical protein
MPTIMIDILNYVQKHSIILDTLRGVYIGGETVSVELRNRITRIFPNIDPFVICLLELGLFACFVFYLTIKPI